jgi:hypothetical protein
VNFDAYLESKKIDSSAFKAADPELWKSWEAEFSQMHPASFTTQKLYLINPIRRLHPLPFTAKPSPVKAEPVTDALLPASPPVAPLNEGAPTLQKPVAAKPAIPRPVFKPKPKTD